MKTIEEYKQFCNLIGVNPKRIFIDSNGTVVTQFHSKKHQLRYAKEIHKYFNKIGFTGSLDTEGKSDLADWEVNAYSEFNAVRH